MILSKDFPVNHDITGINKIKKGKQVGSQPKGWGSIYIAESENCAVKELSNGEWTCFKIGLASDGEASSYKIKCDQATGNSGNYSQVRNYPVNNVGKTEALCHQMWRLKGYSTIKGADHNIPEEYKKFFDKQTGGTEWFCVPRQFLLDEMDKWYSTYKGKAKRVWTCDWIGQSVHNDPIIFKYNAEGLPYAANLTDRTGRQPDENTLKYAWDYRVMTGFAPEGCCSAN